MAIREAEYGTDEYYYSAVTDELNDHGVRTVLADLDEEYVAAAKRFAKKENLPWPPACGDFDTYWEKYCHGR